VAYKDIENSRAAIRRHYYANKEKYLEKNRKRRLKIREYVNAIKASTPCTDCDISYPYYVMDFDHLRDKTDLIGKFVRGSNLSGLKLEIAKCEVVCANCHRIRTHKRTNSTNMPA
jgi:hypothetical protein